jgi:SAM-dependent methyltransferase
METDLYNQLIEKIEARGPHKIYQAWERLDIEGQRPTTMRYGIYGLGKIITPETTVLDLGSNVGFMSLQCAETAREVHGIERYEHWVEIARLAAKCCCRGNCHFHVTDALAFDDSVSRLGTPREFDLMLSLSFHHWGPEVFAKYTEVVYKGLLKVGGHLLFESHAPKTRELFEQYAAYLQSVGFAAVNEGVCQCPTTYPRPNPHRKWYLFELKSK